MRTKWLFILVFFFFFERNMFSQDRGFPTMPSGGIDFNAIRVSVLSGGDTPPPPSPPIDNDYDDRKSRTVVVDGKEVLWRTIEDANAARKGLIVEIDGEWIKFSTKAKADAARAEKVRKEEERLRAEEVRKEKERRREEERKKEERRKEEERVTGIVNTTLSHTGLSSIPQPRELELTPMSIPTDVAKDIIFNTSQKQLAKDGIKQIGEILADIIVPKEDTQNYPHRTDAVKLIIKQFQNYMDESDVIKNGVFPQNSLNDELRKFIFSIPNQIADELGLIKINYLDLERYEEIWKVENKIVKDFLSLIIGGAKDAVDSNYSRSEQYWNNFTGKSVNAIDDTNRAIKKTAPTFIDIKYNIKNEKK